MLIAVAWLIMENKTVLTVVIRMTELLTVVQWLKKAPQIIELVKN